MIQFGRHGEWNILRTNQITNASCAKHLKIKTTKKHLILYRADNAAIIMNKYPYSYGHLMVIPNRHTDDITSLNNNELSDINNLTNKCIHALRNVCNPSGFNIGYNIEGAGLAAHLHRHVLPRHVGDTNFITTIGKTRVIPDLLERQYDQIFPFMQGLNFTPAYNLQD